MHHSQMILRTSIYNSSTVCVGKDCNLFSPTYILIFYFTVFVYRINLYHPCDPSDQVMEPAILDPHVLPDVLCCSNLAETQVHRKLPAADFGQKGSQAPISYSQVLDTGFIHWMTQFNKAHMMFNHVMGNF